MLRGVMGRCKQDVYVRDTYRYTGRVRGGFELHYSRQQCSRKATHGDYCWQHGKEQGALAKK